MCDMMGCENPAVVCAVMSDGSDVGVCDAHRDEIKYLDGHVVKTVEL